MAVLRDLRVVFAQSSQALLGVAVPAQHRIHFGDALGHPLFQQREENVFLAVEVCVEGSARISRLRGNILQTSAFVTIADKNLFGGQQKFAPSRRRASLLARSRWSLLRPG